MNFFYFRFLSKFSLCFLFFAFSSTAITLWDNDYGWHNQQRIAQLCLIIGFSISMLFLPRLKLPRAALALLVLLFLLGLGSSLLAGWPCWALKEWARYLGLAFLILAVGVLAKNKNIHDLVLWILIVLGSVHAFQFLIYYIAAFLSGFRILTVELLFSGFSNARFFGQFQVMLLPVLALMFLQRMQEGGRRTAAFVMFVMIVEWTISFVLDGRGLWLALLLSHIFLMVVNRSLWRLLGLQFAAGMAGFFVYLILFKLVPLWLGIPSGLQDEVRTTLSGREVIWKLAWDMAVLNPWLGGGPMHFSAIYNPIAAHPHQVVLQWLAEWGVIASGIAFLLAAWGGVSSVFFLRRCEVTARDAGVWVAILGAMILAQVDGIFVMPFTETWLAILIGLLMARYIPVVSVRPLQRVKLAFFVMPVLMVLGAILIFEVPTLPGSELAYMQQYGADWAPRFWQQGWIPNPPTR